MIGRRIRHMAKRGRPPKDPFVKLAQALLNASNSQSLASALYKKLGVGDRDLNQELIDGCKELIADYRKGLGMGTLIPTDIFMAYGSLGGEHLTPVDEAIIKANYEAAVAKGKKHQTEGTRGAKQKPLDRAEEVWCKKENEDLRADIKKNSRKLNEATKKIFDEWDKRGDLEKKPTPRTLRKWYNELLLKR